MENTSTSIPMVPPDTDKPTASPRGYGLIVRLTVRLACSPTCKPNHLRRSTDGQRNDARAIAIATRSRACTTSWKLVDRRFCATGPSQLQPKRRGRTNTIPIELHQRSQPLLTPRTFEYSNDPITHSFGFGRHGPGCLSRLLCTRRWCLFDRPFERVWGFTRRWFVR